jgi:hypothetical protein
MPEQDKIDLYEIPDLYAEKDGNWLLLEVLESDLQNEPTSVRLLAESPDKDSIYDHVMEDTDWRWDRRYVIVFADPRRPCRIEELSINKNR